MQLRTSRSHAASNHEHFADRSRPTRSTGHDAAPEVAIGAATRFVMRCGRGHQKIPLHWRPPRPRVELLCHPWGGGGTSRPRRPLLIRGGGSRTRDYTGSRRCPPRTLGVATANRGPRRGLYASSRRGVASPGGAIESLLASGSRTAWRTSTTRSRALAKEWGTTGPFFGGSPPRGDAPPRQTCAPGTVAIAAFAKRCVLRVVLSTDAPPADAHWRRCHIVPEMAEGTLLQS